MKNFAKLLTLAVICSGLAAATPARADRHDFDEEHHHHQDWGRHEDWRMRDADRAHLHDWAIRDHARFCRIHGCERHPVYYAPGTYLPADAYYEPLPSTVMIAPSGFTYVQAAGGVYLMDPHRRIVDSVSLNLNF